MQKDYVAKLVIEEMPRTEKQQEEMISWLQNTIEELKKSDPDKYAEPYTLKLMKL